MSKNLEQGFGITLVNMSDGSVQGHAAGCKDLTRKARGKVQMADEPWEFAVDNKEQARAEYNVDFDEETDGWYDIDWKPCADHVPAGEVEESAEYTMKVCGKWTRFYANGVEVGRIHNDHFAGASALLA